MRKYFKNSILITVVFGLVLILPFLIDGIARFFSSRSNEPTIEFWQYWSGSEREPLIKLVDQFNSENHGFKVKMLSVSMARKKILMAVVGNVAPDLVHLDGDMVTDFALRNALVDLGSLTETKNADEISRRGFIPVYLRMLNIGGHQWALPMMPTCEAMHVNRSLLEHYGLETPRTLEDLVRVFDVMDTQNQHPHFTNSRRDQNRHRRFVPDARRARARHRSVYETYMRMPSPKRNAADGQKSHAEIGWLPSWPPWSGRFIVTMFGGSWGDEHHITANSAENIRAWTWVQENFARKIPSAKLAAFLEGYKAYQSPDNPFFAGKIAIENSGVWEHGMAAKFAPQMRVEVAPFPYDKCHFITNAPTVVTVDALAIPRGAKHPELAMKFMLWLLEQKQIEYLALKQGKFSPLQEVSPGFFDKHPNPYIKTFVELANSANAAFFPQLPCVQRYRREITNSYNKVLRLESSPKEALDELQETMEQICL